MFRDSKKTKKPKKKSIKQQLIRSLNWVILNSPLLRSQIMIVCVILHLAGWVKIKYLHLVRWEALSPGQDCVLALHCRWNRVAIAQTCFWVVVTVGIIFNEDIVAKTWTITWTPVNCISWVFFLHLAHKRCQAFIIVERKDKRFGSSGIATTGFWETKST